VPHIEPP